MIFLKVTVLRWLFYIIFKNLKFNSPTTSIALSLASHKSLMEQEFGQFLHTKRCFMVCISPQWHVVSVLYVIPLLSRLILVGATPVLKRLRFFKVFQSKWESSEGFWYMWLVSGESIAIVLRNPLRDLNRLTGLSASKRGWQLLKLCFPSVLNCACRLSSSGPHAASHTVTRLIRAVLTNSIV